MAVITKETAPRLLIDGDNTFYQAAWVHASLRSPAGEPTGATYGFLRSLLSKMRLYGAPAANVVVCWGDRRSKLRRRELDPMYKANRDEGEIPTPFKIASPQLEPLKQLLTALGVAQAWAEGYEADDVIADLVRTSEGQLTVVISSDHDLQQLASDTVIIATNAGKTWDRAAVVKHYGVEPELLRYVFALQGDPGDGIPKPVPGLGPKTAAAIVAANGPGPSWTFPLKKIPKATSAKIEAALSRIQLNARLIKLGGANATIRPGVPDPVVVQQEFERMGITSLSAELVS